MAQVGLHTVLCASLLAVTTSLGRAAPPEESKHFDNSLAVQTALQQGREYVLHGKYEAAVKVLESQVDRIDGNREYLVTLRDAYRGYVQQLHQSNRELEAQLYGRRLQIIDPTAARETGVKSVSPTQVQVKASAPTPQPGEGTPTIKFRGKSAEPSTPLTNAALASASAQPTLNGDPFQASNHKRFGEARTLVEQAEQAFRERRYREAALFYQQANQILPEAVRDAQERWAYCRLFQVVERLNQPTQPTAEDLKSMDRETRQAIALAPKLEGFGKTVLASLEDRRGGGKNLDRAAPVEPAVTVRHGQSGGGWSVAETNNFRVFHNQSRELAEKVARIAEHTRVTMQKKWFGQVAEDWNPRCDIYLHADADAYARATQVPRNSPGHSTIQNEGSRILSRRVDLHVDHEGMLLAVLPHETTHVVLAGRFGAFQVPRWADEGIAVLSEPIDKIERHTRNLDRHRQEQTLFSVQQLLQLNDYPEPRYVGAFYAQSVSLCQYLANQKEGPQTLVRFIQDGLRMGYEASLKKHYNMSLNDLENGWRAQAFKEGGAVGIAQQMR